MSYTLILLISLSASGPITTDQLGPYMSIQECEQIKGTAIKKMEKDLDAQVKGSCVQEEIPVDKAVKLYENDKLVN